MHLRATTALHFLLICSIGILRPVTNSLALDGLAAQRFYRVYLVSAAVVLVVPLYLRLAERVGWRRFVPGCALFFAVNLLLFRLAYRPGSAVFALAFYGWYDLFAAVMVSQFFVAAQQLFDVRAARRAFPVVLAGGSLGATAGGLLTAVLAPVVGTPNLLFPAAALIAAFAFALRAFWPAPAGHGSAGAALVGAPGPRPAPPRPAPAPLRAILRDHDVLFIAGLVLLGVMVKQLVDFEFNVFTKQVYATRDAVSAFQGYFNAAIQWLPLALLVLVRPLLRRRGVGAVVLLFPLCMLGATLGLALAAGLFTAAAAKALDIGFRNSAERTGREMLYLPLPERVKLRAKSYVDVAVETGLGKLLAALVISAALTVMGYRSLGWVAAALALAWLGMAVAARRHYIGALARSLRARATSFGGLFATVLDANTLAELRRALRGGDCLQVSFAAELLEQADAGEVRQCAPELNTLLRAPAPELRLCALRALARCPEAADLAELRARAADVEPAVAEAAVQLLCTVDPRGPDLLPELLASAEPRTRRAALAALADEPGDYAAPMAAAHVAARGGVAAADRDARLEVALALAAMPHDPCAGPALARLLDDGDPEVRQVALRSAARVADPALDARLVQALIDPATRAGARAALIARGEAVRELLIQVLLDPGAELRLRRQVPGILARNPTPAKVVALISALEARETDRLLDYRILKALNRMRARHPELVFPPDAVGRILDSEIEGSRASGAALAALAPHAGRPAVDLLLRSVREALADHRERLFRALALLHAPDEMYRCYQAIVGADAVARGHALEWLEETVGARAFARLPLADAAPAQAAAPDAGAALARLAGSDDAWLAELADRAARELFGGVGRAARVAGRGLLQERAVGAAGLAPVTFALDPAMELIERVFLLQQVDLLRGATAQQLALLASIAQEVAADPGAVVLHRGEPTDAMHVVVDGSVELRGAGEQVVLAQQGTAFGTWALIDESPSLVDARVVEPGRLLRITRGDFDELLSDHHELALGLLRGLARRVRALAEL